MADRAEIVIVGETPEQIIRDDAERIRRRMPIDSRARAVIAEKLISAEAPVETGKLRRSVRARQRRRPSGRFSHGFEIVAGAERDGFPYLDVTRFGHRSHIKFIVPKRGEYLKLRSGGRRRTVFRRAVRAYHPRSDWVQVGVNRTARVIQRLHQKAEGG